MDVIYEQKDIAPTIAEILNLAYNVPTGESIELEEDLIGKNVVLAIIDCFDWDLYEKYGKDIITEVVEVPFFEYRVSSSAPKTSPAIATILTGLAPEEHSISSTADVESSNIINLPEFAERNGVETTVVMEARGANTFSDNIEEIHPIKDREDIIEFDDEILESVRKSINRFSFIVCHIRTIDKFLHRGERIEKIRGELERITKKIIDIAKPSDYLLILTGDHKSHGDVFEGNNIQPFIIINFSKNPKCTKTEA